MEKNSNENLNKNEFEISNYTLYWKKDDEEFIEGNSLSINHLLLTLMNMKSLLNTQNQLSQNVLNYVKLFYTEKETNKQSPKLLKKPTTKLTIHKVKENAIENKSNDKSLIKIDGIINDK